MHHASHTVTGYLVEGMVLVGAGLAEVRQGDHNESRVDIAQRFIGESKPGHDTGAEAFDQNVGPLGESL